MKNLILRETQKKIVLAKNEKRRSLEANSSEISSGEYQNESLYKKKQYNQGHKRKLSYEILETEVCKGNITGESLIEKIESKIQYEIKNKKNLRNNSYCYYIQSSL